MTLRTKLTLALVLLSVVTTGLIGSIAYFATVRQLTTEIDRSLRDVAAYAAAQNPGRDGGGHGDNSVVQLQTVLVQQLDVDGAVSTAPAGVSVPVSDVDRAIARHTMSTPTYREVRIEDRAYRMLTTESEHGAVQVLRPLAERDGVLSALRLQILLAAVLVILAAAAAGWLVSRRITRRLRELAAAATVVADTGRLDIPVATNAGTDETGQLTTAFARMLQALDQSQLAQRRLVQDAGHELRTPLTSLRTNLDVLARHGDLDAGRRQAIVTDLHGETRELSALVNELIELSLGGSAPAQAGPVLLLPLAHRIAERARRRTSRTITVIGPESSVWAVPAQVERALSNLVDNALKFSPAESDVEIRLEPGRVSVRDYGPGIGPADQPRVFDRFYRSDRARQLPGSGLGLAIVHDLITRAGGTVFIDTPAGGGARVGFSLPVVDPPPAGGRFQPGSNPG